MAWFRFHDDAVDHPKIAGLSGDEFKFWVRLLSVASKHRGLIPPLEALKGVLRARLDHLKRYLNALLKAGLIDEIEGGYKPHDWDKWQYISDTSTERVKKHRAAKRNVNETFHETASEQSRTETEQKGPPKSPNLSKRPAPRETVGAGAPLSEDFEIWYFAYPRREARGQAIKAYQSARKKTDALTLLNGAKRYAEFCRGKDRQYIALPATWLNGERWLDESGSVSTSSRDWREALL